MGELSVVIQAGGKSSRMGEDKGLMDFGGISLVEFVYSQMKGLSEDIFVVTNQPCDYKFLGIPVFMDVLPNVGALGGLYTALTYAANDWVLVAACDMPFINLEVIEYLMSCREAYDVVVPVVGEKQFAEPFRSLYKKDSLGAIERAIGEGRRRAIAFYDDVKVREVASDEIKRIDPEGLTFYNVNTQEDYQRALKLIDR